MKETIKYLKNLKCENISYFKGGFESLHKYAINYNDDILEIENNLKKSKAFYPYIQASIENISYESKLKIINDISEFYKEVKKTNIHKLIINQDYTGIIKIVPESRYTSCFLEEDNANTYELYKKEFNDLNSFLSSKVKDNI